MDTEVLDIDTAQRRTVDFTEAVRAFCGGHGDGLCNVFVPHATAGVAPSITVPVTGGTPLLGTWQSVVLIDLNRDNARRSVRLSFVGA